MSDSAISGVYSAGETSQGSSCSLGVTDFIALAEAATSASGFSLRNCVPDLNFGETELTLGLPDASNFAAAAAAAAGVCIANGDAGGNWQHGAGMERISCRGSSGATFTGRTVGACASAAGWFAENAWSAAAAGGGTEQISCRVEELPAGDEERTLLGVAPRPAATPPPRVMNRSTIGVKRGYSEAICGEVVEQKAFATSLHLPTLKQNRSDAHLDCNVRTRLALPVFPWGNVNQMMVSKPMDVDQAKVPSHPFMATSQQRPKYNSSGIGAASFNGSDPRVNRDVCNRVSQISTEPAAGDVSGQKDELDIAGDTSKTVHGSSAPVVGWPPVQSFRNKALASHSPSKLTKERQVLPPADSSARGPAESAPINAPFVKVYMDGIAIGRKVDLHSCNSYEQLSFALEEMFHLFITASKKMHGFCKWSMVPVKENGERSSFHASEYVLTYEDKDGDLMLMGDVPWSLFLGTVKRLRIMKGSDAVGLAPKASEKVKAGGK